MTIGTALAGRGTVPAIVPPDDAADGGGAAVAAGAGCSFEHEGTQLQSTQRAQRPNHPVALRVGRSLRLIGWLKRPVIDTSPARAPPRCRRDSVLPTAAASTSGRDRRRARPR